MRLAIVGTGYVGLVTGTCLANSGNRVICLDTDAAKIALLASGSVPIYEPGLAEMVGQNLKAGRLIFTSDKAAAYGQAEVVFICVGTPTGPNGQPDLSAVMVVARDIGQALEAAAKGAAAPVVVVKSTVPVSTNQRVAAEIAAHTRRPFLMASNPEFLKEGAAIADFTRPDRVVIGAEEPEAIRILHELYEPFVRQGNPILTMDIRSAEMVKYASNAMLAAKISFINEIAALCEAFGADVDQVRRGMSADKRIGNQFLYPGLGFGGSCFPKDLLACIGMGESSGQATPILRAVESVNRAQRQRFWEKIAAHYGPSIRGARIGIWGLAFKAGTDDMREAPATTLIERLLGAGGLVQAYDPAAAGSARAIFGDRITYADTALEVIRGALGLVICTDWDEFKRPDLAEMKSMMAKPVVFDGRNLYRPETMQRAGFYYYSVGRAPVRPA